MDEDQGLTPEALARIEERIAARRQRLAKHLGGYAVAQRGCECVKLLTRARIRLNVEARKPRPAPHMLGHWERAQERLARRRVDARIAARHVRLAKLLG